MKVMFKFVIFIIWKKQKNSKIVLNNLIAINKQKNVLFLMREKIKNKIRRMLLFQRLKFNRKLLRLLLRKIFMNNQNLNNHKNKKALLYKNKSLVFMKKIYHIRKAKIVTQKKFKTFLQALIKIQNLRKKFNQIMNIMKIFCHWKIPSNHNQLRKRTIIKSLGMTKKKIIFNQ